MSNVRCALPQFVETARRQPNCSRRGVLFAFVLGPLAACGSGPNIFPGVLYRSDHPVSSSLLADLTSLARSVGFVEDTSQAQLDTALRHRYVLMRLSNRAYPAFAVDTHKSDGQTYVVIWDASVGGAEFPAESAAVVRRFETALRAALPGVFSGRWSVPQ
jgi:hypothetical protein